LFWSQLLFAISVFASVLATTILFACVLTATAILFRTLKGVLLVFDALLLWSPLGGCILSSEGNNRVSMELG